MDEFVDACSVETFVNDGQVVLTALAVPGRESDGIELATSRLAQRVIAVQAWRLSSNLPE
jgi:sucrose-6-phosphate hydrolase SacC (GH32 family)